MRLVTTGDRDGRSVVIEDVDVPARIVGRFPGAEFFLLWGTDEVPSLPLVGERPQDAWIPGPNGARFGISILPPAYAPAPAEQGGSEAADLDGLLPGLARTLEPDAPGMHTTDTVDFVLVVSGSVTLEVDDGEVVVLRQGECLVQGGVRHAWRNLTDEPCVLAICMVGGSRQATAGAGSGSPSG